MPADELSDPNSTSLPTHPGNQCVAMSCLCNLTPLPTQGYSANSTCEACTTYTTQAACPNQQCVWTGSKCEAANCTKHRFWGQQQLGVVPSLAFEKRRSQAHLACNRYWFALATLPNPCCVQAYTTWHMLHNSNCLCHTYEHCKPHTGFVDYSCFVQKCTHVTNVSCFSVHFPFVHLFLLLEALQGFVRLVEVLEVFGRLWDGLEGFGRLCRLCEVL